ncbi:radical SAM family heme chaperone HemW [Henriciella litoralis]|uniref:radical SAM family heme chaperone HemW n=1 Tax=Henriciella litoralis TaxID=568102 RepID=UPI001F40EFBD|nr:radical SAM family heme chaperone HemW [Henriciella litoralis]
MTPPTLPFGPHYGFGLYLHWPYCTRICPYCDFNVYAAKDRDPGALIAAMSADIQRHADRLKGHPPLTSLYFGGGTPSLMPPAEIEAMIALADRLFGLAPGAEITLEANPNDVSATSPSDWAAAGVTRLSLGIQSLDDDALRFLGREHDSAGARTAVQRIAPVFDNFSIDLIYARPGQTEAEWQAELTAALQLGAPHLSLYELTIEERTAFGRRATRGELSPMLDDDQADLYELTQDITAAHGLPAYEVSNHASGPAYQSQHNLIYWRGGDWIGIGPGAHGRISLDGQRIATIAARKPAVYIAENTPPDEHLSALDAARELLALGLRPLEGFDLARLAQLTGAMPPSDKIEDLVSAGLVTHSGSHIALTASGRLLADRITMELAP